jgi:hypothetical protein
MTQMDTMPPESEQQTVLYTTASSTTSTSAGAPTGASSTIGPATATIAMPASQTSGDNIALIGGIVGGTVALLLIVGVIVACVLARNRQSNRDNTSLQPKPIHSNQYSDLNDVRAPNN